MKKFKLFLMLALAVLAFAACSSDDDDTQTGTFEYQISYSKFNGSLSDMSIVNKAFANAFGVSTATFTLTGTQKECDRKAKEYAIKAAAEIGDENSFEATVVFSNVNTGATVYTFDILKSNNGYVSKDDWCTTTSTSLTLTKLQGKQIKIVSGNGTKIFDGKIDKDPWTFNIDTAKYGKFINVTVEGGIMFHVILGRS